MRINPDKKYYKMPSSYIGVGCAFEDIYKKSFDAKLPDDLNVIGYIPLDKLDDFINKYLNVNKKHYLNGNERLTLMQFLAQNDQKCCVYVYGHFLYINGSDYWSYYINDKTEVVCVWYLKER